jgi:hypothetical protein
LIVRPDALDQRLTDLLLAADRAHPPRAMPPVPAIALRARLARQNARRAAVISVAAAIGLFAAFARPARAPDMAHGPAAISAELEIAFLEREANSIRVAALAMLAERDRALASRRHEPPAGLPVADISAAAVENAAFLLYCEADRLSQRDQTLGAARERYSAVAQRFPGTVWARMAAEVIVDTSHQKRGIP